MSLPKKRMGAGALILGRRVRRSLEALAQSGPVYVEDQETVF